MKTARKNVLMTFVAVMVFAIMFAAGAFYVSSGKNVPKATASEIEVETETFATVGASVRLMGKQGLRFTTYVNKDFYESHPTATYGTLIIPTSVLGENELNVNTAYVQNAETVNWGEEDGDYMTYHAVLTDIPDTDYATAITACAYVLDGGVYSYENTMERTIGQVAAAAIKSGEYMGADLENLTDFVDTAIGDADITLNKINTAISVGDTDTLSVAGYDAVWVSDDESVATVSADGTVTGVAYGVATVTATVGSKSATCSVAVLADPVETSWGTLQPTIQKRPLTYPDSWNYYEKASEYNYDSVNGVFTVSNVKSNSGFRFYSDELDGYSKGDTVSITMTYKYVLPNAATYSTVNSYRSIITPASDGSVVYNAITPNSGEWSTVTFDAIISNASDDYVYLNNVKDKTRYAYNESRATIEEVNARVAALFNGTYDNNIQFAFNIPKNSANEGTYIEIKSIGITPTFTQTITTEQVIDAGSVNLATALGISNVKGTLSYNVTDKDGASVAVANGAFTATAQNYYDVTPTATNAAGNTYNGTMVRLIVKDTCIAVSGATVTESDGTLTLTSTADWSKYRFFLDGLEDYNVGDIVYVTMTYRVNVPSNAGQRIFIVGKGDAQVDQTLFGTGDSGVVTKVFPAAVCTSNYDYSPLTSITGNKAKHIKITTLFYDNTGKKSVYPVTMTVSNIALTPYFEMATTEAVIDASSEIDIATVAGIDNVFGTMSYTVADKNGSPVAVMNNKFTSGTAQNYYDITATATVCGNTTSKTTRFIVKGTFIASSGYSAINYTSNTLTATKLSTESLTNFRLYLDGLEDYDVGDLVYVTMDYRADIQSTASQKFLVIGKNTGNNTYPAITINADSTITFVAAVCTADDDFTGMISLTTLSGNRAKHIKVETWFYNAATEPKGHVTGSFTIKSAYVSKVGYAETVRSSATSSVNSEGNLVLNNVADSTCRFYFNDLSNFNAGDTVAVTLKYKYNYTATEPNAQSRCFYGPTSTSAFGLLINRGTLVCDGEEHTVTFNTVVSNTAGNPNYNTGNIVGGTNAKNLIIDTWLTAGTTFEITDVSIAAT